MVKRQLIHCGMTSEVGGAGTRKGTHKVRVATALEEDTDGGHKDGEAVFS